METNEQQQPNLRAEYSYSVGSDAPEVPKPKLAAAINCNGRTFRKKNNHETVSKKTYLRRATSTMVNSSLNQATPRIVRDAKTFVTSADVNLFTQHTY